MHVSGKASAGVASGAGSAAVSASRCAAVMLDGLPPVMWFIRCRMRKHRTRGLSVPQFRALALLDRYPTAGVSLVAEHLGSSQPSASRLVSGLVSRGFVTRRACADDRRQVKLVLTAAGANVLRAARAAAQASVAAEIERLDERQRATVEAAMVILRDVFDRRRGSACGRVDDAGAAGGCANGDATEVAAGVVAAAVAATKTSASPSPSPSAPPRRKKTVSSGR